ncbi:hypothetical protein Acsp01_72730 [Actinoplanes sp. NBRC 101535]|nr:hypothetical protein Acsp01_72730 [Actinoplanes sp. NBRC 101535]
MADRGPAGRMAGLFHEDVSLTEGVSWLIDQHLRSWENRPGAARLKQVALEVLDDGLLPDGYRVRGVDSEGLWVEHGDHRFPLREMSDGYRTVAALVVDLLKQVHEAFGALDTHVVGGVTTVHAPGVVIIDEVDAHLHVSWQKRIGFSGIFSAMAPQDTPYSDRAVALRRELVDLETSVLTGRADEQAVDRYEQLRDLLTSSPAARVDELAARLARDPGRPRP